MLVAGDLKKPESSIIGESLLILFATGLSLLVAGCPAEGSYLLQITGITRTEAVYPFQGLEFQLLAIILLRVSTALSSRKLIQPDTSFVLKEKLPGPLLGILAILLLIFSPLLPESYRFNYILQYDHARSAEGPQQEPLAANIEKVNPPEGYTINTRFNKIGWKLRKNGVIDLEKFKDRAKKAGNPLTEEQLEVFRPEVSNRKITITRDNSRFLLNFFWALGVINRNPLLLRGPITERGPTKINSYASIGGWNLGQKPPIDLFASQEVIDLTDEQWSRVKKVAENSYRPCCDNPTAFPDCNHGLAVLGMLQLLGAEGASVEQLYEATKYFNAYWFPEQYLGIYRYYRATDIAFPSFSEADPEILVGGRHASLSGWRRVKNWLASEGLLPGGPSLGSEC